MRNITCHGPPYEVGLTHGKRAADLIAGSIEFYTHMFQANSGKSWAEVRQIAATFHASILAKWPRYAEEMRGIATGAGVSILDIVALNVRTEIAYGLRTATPSDGCTSAYYRATDSAGGLAGSSTTALQGQNWDWQREQAPHLLYLTINAAASEGCPPLPRIKMITEAGIIGKIGINSAGVGVCFNALGVPGVDYEGLPAHLALRTALEATSQIDAQHKIMETSAGGRMASSAFILIGCRDGAIGCEFAATATGAGNGCVWQPMEDLQYPRRGEILVHTNHCLLPHPGSAEERVLVADSPDRIHRMKYLIQLHTERLTKDDFASFFKDEKGYPCSINRKQEGASEIESLFNIVIDFGEGQEAVTAKIKMGRPTETGEEFVMSFD